MTSSIPLSTLEKFTTFGDLLRFLRRRAGITQMELAIAVGYSDAQISRLEQNLRLPDLTTLEARFIPALSLEDEPKVVSRLLDLAANVRREDAPGLGLCPYKGLSYFDEADADLFVGREELTSKLTERVLSLTSSGAPHRTRFLAVIGASGSGKSSLVRAGLIPALRWNKRSAEWNIYTLIPTAHPLESLASALTTDKESVVATATLMDDLLRDPRSLQLYLKHKLQTANDDHVLIVVDQFEEIFALCRSEEERTAFIGNLLTAASEADGPITVIITLRADFYAQCANFVELREAVAEEQEFIGAMNEDELRRAIEEPAKRGRWEFEPGLVDLLLHDVGNEPGSLPLLSHALLETWHRRRGRMMTMSGYASSGGVRGAISETAESVFTDQFNSDQKNIARRIFLRLTELSDEASTADTRRRATFKELILKPEEAGITQSVLKALADARLITTTEDSAEVAHEALIREWRTLRGWLDENRAGLRLHRQLTETSQEWSTLEHSPDLLYRGARLAQAREWAVAHDDELNSLEREFLVSSIEAGEREAAEREIRRQQEMEAAHKLAEAQRHRAESERQRAEEQSRSATQLRKRAYYLSGAFAIAVVMALAAWFFATQAQTTSRISTSRELAAASISNLEVDPERSILLALEALNTSYTVEAEDALHRAVQASRVQLVIPAHEPDSPMSVSFSPDGMKAVTSSLEELVKVWDAETGDPLFTVEGHFAVFSPDGKRIASAVGNGTVNLWDAETGREIRLPNPIQADIGISFSPDGARMATTASGNIVKIWDANTGEELAELIGHTDYVLFTYFSPDGNRLLSVSDDHTARVWDVKTGKQLFSLSEHGNWVTSGMFSPNGRLIATASGNEAYLWNAATGEKLMTLAGHTSEVLTIVFSPDGSQIATGSADRKIKLWNAETGEELFSLFGHIGGVYNLAFSPNGSRLLSGSNDGTARIWNIEPSRELFTISQNDPSGQVAFNPEGTQFASTFNGGIKIWSVYTGKALVAIPDPAVTINEILFSPDGARIFRSGDDAKVKIWDVKTGNELGTITGHTSDLNEIALTMDGKRLATAGVDYSAKVWDISSSQISNALLLTLENPNVVHSVAFDPTGSILATGVEIGSVHLWDMNNGKEIRIMRGHATTVLDVAFNPDGTRIASASADRTAKVWNVSTGEELFTLHGHASAITSIAYSPDGTRVATASADGTAKLWDASTGVELLTFPGDGSELSDVAFSPDGKLLATGGENGTRIYLLKIDDLIALAKTRVTRSLTSEECQKYLHLDRSTCSPSPLIVTTTAMPPAANGRVCQVTDTAGLYDNYFNETIYKGLQDSNALFGWEVRTLQSAISADFETNIKEFLRGSCDLIVGIATTSDAMQVVAQANPNQKFLLVDNFYEQPLDNVQTPIYTADQAAFLAGYTAASVTKTGKVGVFGGIPLPPVTGFMDGFAFGVSYYNEKNGTNVEVLGWDPETREGLFIGEFCCAAEGRQIAEELLDASADIILPVAGKEVGAGAILAVHLHGDAYFIGVDNDWAINYPQYADIILTSIMKNFDVSVVRAVKATDDGTFAGGIHIGNLETGEVSLAPFHRLDSLVSDKVKTDLEQIKADIIAGKIKTSASYEFK